MLQFCLKLIRSLFVVFVSTKINNKKQKERNEKEAGKNNCSVEEILRNSREIPWVSISKIRFCDSN